MRSEREAEVSPDEEDNLPWFLGHSAKRCPKLKVCTGWEGTSLTVVRLGYSTVRVCMCVCVSSGHVLYLSARLV